MSVTPEQLDAAIAALQAVKTVYEQQSAGFEQRFADLEQAFAAAVVAVPIMYKSFYIDPVNGDDAAAGTSSTPWKTLDRALTALEGINAGHIRLNLGPGVHTWTTAKVLKGLYFEILPAYSGTPDSVFLDYLPDNTSLYNCYLSIRAITVRLKPSANSAPHMKSMFRMYGGSATIGGYVGGAVSPTNRMMHVISEGRPFLSSEVVGFFAGLEGVYAENIDGVSTPNFIESRGTSSVLHNHMNCAFDQMLVDMVQLQNALGATV